MKNIISAFSTLVALCLLLGLPLSSCEKDPDPVDPPAADTTYFTVEGVKMSNGSLSKNGYNTVEITGDFSKLVATTFKVIDYGHVISPFINRPTLDNNSGFSSLGSRTSPGQFASKIQGLSPNTVYYARAYVKIQYLSDNHITTGYHDFAISFRTMEGSAPLVITEQPSNVTQNSIVIPGFVSDLNLLNIEQYGHVWSKSNTHPTVEDCDNRTQLGSLQSVSNHNFSSNLTNLQPNTTYYVRAYAKNIFGTGYGDAVQVSTGSAPATGGSVFIRNDFGGSIAINFQNQQMDIPAGETREFQVQGTNLPLDLWQCVWQNNDWACNWENYAVNPGKHYRVVMEAGAVNYDLTLLEE